MGFVGDVKQVNDAFLADLIHKGVVPVMAPLTHDGDGHMLNTNATLLPERPPRLWRVCSM